MCCPVPGSGYAGPYCRDAAVDRRHCRALWRERASASGVIKRLFGLPDQLALRLVRQQSGCIAQAGLGMCPVEEQVLASDVGEARAVTSQPDPETPVLVQKDLVRRRVLKAARLCPKRPAEQRAGRDMIAFQHVRKMRRGHDGVAVFNRAEAADRGGNHVVAIVFQQEDRFFDIGRPQQIVRVQAADVFPARGAWIPKLRLSPTGWGASRYSTVTLGSAVLQAPGGWRHRWSRLPPR